MERADVDDVASLEDVFASTSFGRDTSPAALTSRKPSASSAGSRYFARNRLVASLALAGAALSVVAGVSVGSARGGRLSLGQAETRTGVEAPGASGVASTPAPATTTTPAPAVPTAPEAPPTARPALVASTLATPESSGSRLVVVASGSPAGAGGADAPASGTTVVALPVATTVPTTTTTTQPARSGSDPSGGGGGAGSSGQGGYTLGWGTGGSPGTGSSSVGSGSGPGPSSSASGFRRTSGSAGGSATWGHGDTQRGGPDEGGRQDDGPSGAQKGVGGSGHGW